MKSACKYFGSIICTCACARTPLCFVRFVFLSFFFWILFLSFCLFIAISPDLLLFLLKFFCLVALFMLRLLIHEIHFNSLTSFDGKKSVLKNNNSNNNNRKRMKKWKKNIEKGWITRRWNSYVEINVRTLRMYKDLEFWWKLQQQHHHDGGGGGDGDGCCFVLFFVIRDVL